MREESVILTTKHRIPSSRAGLGLGVPCIYIIILVFILYQIQTLPWMSLSNLSPSSCKSDTALTSKLRDSVTFLPLKSLKFAKTAMIGNTWFMSSLNDIYEGNLAEYLYFPSAASKGRLLCLKGNSIRDGSSNYYALAWPEALPDSAIFMEGLTFVSDTYYDYTNLWHGICAMTPFVGWSIRNQCVKPRRWVLYHWGELRDVMGPWIENLMQANFGQVIVEGLKDGDATYCFEKAVVMRHNLGKMGVEAKIEAFNLLRCKARTSCGINPKDGKTELNESGVPIIRLTLLMMRGPRSFKNVTAVENVFSRECERVQGCRMRVVQSEDLSFCDQVKLLSSTDVVASPHGAQMTNMVFMDRGSSVMEFFPRGWLEHAGVGKHAHHWFANQSGMKHQGAWWEPLGEEDCPDPKDKALCFHFHKNGKLGHNETFFGQWARDVLNRLRSSKMKQVSNSSDSGLSAGECIC